MKESLIPIEPDVMKPDSTTVFSFPMKSPTGAITTYTDDCYRTVRLLVSLSKVLV